MGEASRATETTASPATVWKTWSDTSTWPTWNPDIKWVKLDGGFASGTTGTMETNSGGKHNIVLSNVHQEREFTLTSDVPMPATKVVFRCAIESTAGGPA
ncbi:MAG: SRPBCC family protein [Candidatus Dormibacteria bacterium]